MYQSFNFINMIFFILLITLTAAFNKDVLRSALQSAREQVILFSSWTKAEHKDFDAQQRKFRLRIFKKNLKKIVEINDGQDMYELDANFMAGLSEQEQQKWYGINITEFPVERSAEKTVLRSYLTTATKKLWRKEGKVTPVKNQGGCGSCWSFSAIGSFEGHYAIKTGKLKRFSEQEFLDCTYSDNLGCHGGQYVQAYTVLKETQHLSLEKDYPYEARDGHCLTDYRPNGMTAAKLISVVFPPTLRKDAGLVQALNVGPVVMSIELKGGFNYYKKGILSVHNCGSVPHHVMTVTGYTAEFFEIKNSWGSSWGEAGYCRSDRKIENMCGISNWLVYPELQKTGDEPNDDTQPTEKPFYDKYKECTNEYSGTPMCNYEKGCNYGCHEGYCWSQCKGGSQFGNCGQLGEWCWSNNGGGDYQKCGKNQDCNSVKNNSCIGACSV